jgi:hypothetical protein
MTFGDLEFHGHFDIFFSWYTEVVPGRVQQPIADAIGPWGANEVIGANYGVTTTF